MVSRVGVQPLCPAGRCGQILAALAEAQAMTKLGELYGAAIADVIRSVLIDLGVEVNDAAVAESVIRHINRVGGAPWRGPADSES